MESDHVSLSLLMDITTEQIQEFVGLVDSIKLMHPLILASRIPDHKAEKTLKDEMSKIKMKNADIRNNFTLIENVLKTLHHEESLFLHGYQALLDSYFIIIRRYHEEQETFKEKCKFLLKGHLREVTEIGDEEMDKMIQAENFSEFKKKYALVSDEQKRDLECAESRHETIANLQKCIDLLNHQIKEHESVVRSMNQRLKQGKTSWIESMVRNSTEAVGKAINELGGTGHKSCRPENCGASNTCAGMEQGENKGNSKRHQEAFGRMEGTTF